MRRREFVALIGAGTAWPLARGAAQQPARAAMPTIGFLGIGSRPITERRQLPAFRQGLSETGFQEGTSVAIDYVWADGRYDRLGVLAAELVSRRVKVIVAAGGTIAALAAKKATADIPIIALAGEDPVRVGLVESINRPGSNVTGVAQLVAALEPKRLELLQELIPGARKVALVQNPKRPNAGRQTQELLPVADRLGLTLTVMEAADDERLVDAFRKARGNADAVLVAADPFFYVRSDQIVDLARESALPAMYFFREFVDGGGLISYGSNLSAAFVEVGRYAGRILGGAAPATLPMVQQTDRVELVLNLKAARSLGLVIPASVLARADEVIE